jgi:hypothetical protein
MFRDYVLYNHQSQEKCFLNSKLPDAAAFSCSIHKGNLFFVTMLNLASWYHSLENGTMQDCCGLL